MGKRIMLAYGSETGNTEAGARLIARRLEELGHAVTMAKAPDVGVDIFDGPYDAWLLGASTWGADQNEVAQDFQPFYDAMVGVAFNGKPVAVFGSGDIGYGQENFARAVDYVQSRATAHGARLLTPSLKWNQQPDEERAAIIAWAEAVSAALGLV